MIHTLTLNPAIDRELTVSQLQTDSVLRAKSLRIDFGGKGINVSRVLLALGIPSVTTGFLGGNNGKLLENGLHGLGIPTDFVWLEQETRTNISIVAEQDGHYIKVNESGPTISFKDQQTLLEKIDRSAHPGDWWILAGNLPPGIPQNFYASILQLLNQHGTAAIFDTSGEPLQIGLLEMPFLVKPNAEEASLLTGMPVKTISELKAVAAAIRNLGAKNVVISLGKQGALLQTKDETWLAHAPAIEQKNPIGAGDSMVGGFVYALHQGLSMREALGWGAACGAATASLPGTQIGNIQQVISLLESIHIEKI